MNQYNNQPKKPSGCLLTAGWGALILAAIMVAFGIVFWIYDDQEWTRKQDEESMKMVEWEKLNDTIQNSIYRLDSLAVLAYTDKDKASFAAYEDSIVKLLMEKSDEELEKAEMGRLDSLLKVSLGKGLTPEAWTYKDSIHDQALNMIPPLPERKYLGFPLGGLVSVFVFILAALPFILGIILLVVYYSKRSSYKNSQRMNMPPPVPPASVR